MQTVQVMNRPLFGGIVQQRTGDGFFLLASVEKAGDHWRREHKMPAFNVSGFLSQKRTVEFIEALEAKVGAAAMDRSGRGRARTTWVHPYLMLEVAFAMAPELKVEVYGWIFDELIKYRDESGDSYKDMCGVLFTKFQNKKMFGHFIADTANQIREACKVSDAPKPWNSASETQLKLRDKIHETIAMAGEFCPDPRLAVRMGIEKALRPKK